MLKPVTCCWKDHREIPCRVRRPGETFNIILKSKSIYMSHVKITLFIYDPCNKDLSQFQFLSLSSSLYYICISTLFLEHFG